MPKKPSPYRRHVLAWQDCQRCDLCTQRRRIVLGRGALPAPVLFIGEAPGPSEDVLGYPFAGPAGKLFDMIVAMADLDRHKLPFAITNLVACFPREAKQEGFNEPPTEAIESCMPRLREFAALCRPQLIVLVGKLAARWVYGAASLRSDDKPEQPDWVPHGEWLEFIEIIHPAAILRMESVQKPLAIKRSVITIADAVAKL